MTDGPMDTERWTGIYMQPQTDRQRQIHITNAEADKLRHIQTARQADSRL